MIPLRLGRHTRRLERRLRQARMFVRALQDGRHPVAAHLIPTRRCNLACAYCNEFDDHSQPVPTPEVLRRVDLLAALGTSIVTLSGGEPLLHPDLDEIIAHIRTRGMIATIITNGYLLTRDRVARLNRAGLDHLQISIDNVLPDDVSKKSLKVLDTKLRWLAEDADFDVTINSVVGGRIHNPADALAIARRASALGLSTTVGIIHDGAGQLLPLEESQRDILQQIVRIGRSTFDCANYNGFQKKLCEGQPNEWHCRAGARYLYICEDGLVHWCSQQRGQPGIPLGDYGPGDFEREYHRPKGCAPFCTVGCVHRVAQLDELRERPLETLRAWFSPEAGGPARPPIFVRLLMWMFVTGGQRRVFQKGALRLFRPAMIPPANATSNPDPPHPRMTSSRTPNTASRTPDPRTTNHEP
jgi:MoaA/NifB/PqqE/SkfB family radical SAM enzyme